MYENNLEPITYSGKGRRWSPNASLPAREPTSISNVVSVPCSRPERAVSWITKPSRMGCWLFALHIRAQTGRNKAWRVDKGTGNGTFCQAWAKQNLGCDPPVQNCNLFLDRYLALNRASGCLPSTTASHCAKPKAQVEEIRQDKRERPGKLSSELLVPQGNDSQRRLGIR